MLTRFILGNSANCFRFAGARCFSQNTQAATVPRFTIADQLTDEQTEYYNKNGFLLVKSLVPNSELQRYQKRFIEIANLRLKVPGLTVQKDVAFKEKPYNERTVYKLQELFLDSELFSYCTYKPILDIVEQFLGHDLMAIHTMLINKPPDSGQKTTRHPLHQDMQYFPMRPADKIIAAWTAIDAVSRENGCLVVLPQSHKGELLEHIYPEWPGINKAFHGIKDFDKNQPRLYVEMGPGDTLFMHPLLIHGSGTNRTDGYRKAISCHYASSDCKYIDVRGTSQQFTADEIIEMANKKFGIQINDVTEIWKFRSQLVRGQRRNI